MYNIKVIFLILISAVFSTGFEDPGPGISLLQTKISDINGIIEKLKTVPGTLEDNVKYPIQALSNEIIFNTGIRTVLMDSLKNAIVYGAGPFFYFYLEDLEEQLNVLLSEIQKMAENHVSCISLDRAKRLGAWKDSIMATTDSVDVAVKGCINLLYTDAIDVVNFNKNRMIVIENSKHLRIIKMILTGFFIILLLAFSFSILKLRNCRNKLLYRILLAICMIFMVPSALLRFDNDRLERYTGSKIEVPCWEETCRNGLALVKAFGEMAKSGVFNDSLSVSGEKSFSDFMATAYLCVSPGLEHKITRELQHIQVTLFPPAGLPAQFTPCSETIFIDPSWVSCYDFSKVKYFNYWINLGLIPHSRIDTEEDALQRRNLLKYDPENFPVNRRLFLCPVGEIKFLVMLKLKAAL